MEQKPNPQTDLDSSNKNRLSLGIMDQIISSFTQKFLEHCGGHTHIVDYATSLEAAASSGEFHLHCDWVRKCNKFLVG